MTPPIRMVSVPLDVATEAVNCMARAYERVHSLPRVSDTELANRVGAAKEALRVALTAAPVREEGGAVDAEAVRVALDQARRGADKAGCDGWRAQEMCRQIAQLLEKALATREEAPDWTARTEAAWAENNREEAPADHVSDARQMVEAPAEAGESLCRLSALLSASHLAGDAAVAGLGAVCWNDLRAVLDVALRAQAQAREGECQ